MPDFSALIVSIWEKLESKKHSLSLILISAYFILLAYIVEKYRMEFLDAFPFLKYVIIITFGIGLGSLTTNIIFYICEKITLMRVNYALEKQKKIDNHRKEASRKITLENSLKSFKEYYRHFTDSQIKIIREMSIKESIMLNTRSDWTRNLVKGGWISAVANINPTSKAYKLNNSIQKLVISIWNNEIQENVERMLSFRSPELDKILNYFEKKGSPEDDEIIEIDFIGHPYREYILYCFKIIHESNYQLTLCIQTRYQDHLEDKLGKKLIPSRTFTYKVTTGSKFIFLQSQH